jgi:hypothetical protein
MMGRRGGSEEGGQDIEGGESSVQLTLSRSKDHSE